jgi:uncharacterized protein
MKRILSLLILGCCGIAALAILFETAPWSASVAAQAQHIEAKIDPKLFDEYVGRYGFVTDPEFVLSFWREGDKFFMQATDQLQVDIFPESDRKFFLIIVDAQVTFLRDSQGQVTGATWRQGGRDNATKRISNQPDIRTPKPFERREVMIRMRDGVRLHTLIFVPEKISEPLPILIDRTPYGIDRATSDSINSRYASLVKDGYIFVAQDIRGRYGSEGQFLMTRPLREKKDPKSFDESTDAYDTIDWLIKNVPKNNGRVGILGVSYDGWLAAVATVDPHPALKASSPQAPMTDVFLGDDFFHNGAFRQSYGYEYVKSMESSKENTSVSFDRDAYDWYLSLGSLSKITEEVKNKLPTWNAFVAHPSYDDFWKARSAGIYLKQTPVATLVVGGWWDQEDFYGALKTYETLEKHDKDHKNFVVLGPWNHGGWGGRGSNLGSILFGSSTGAYFRDQIQAPWFAYYLKGKGEPKQPEAVTFQTGNNQWVSSDQWPPKEAVNRDLFMTEGKRLSFSAPPRSNEVFETYVSDPARPVPYRKRPIEATYDPKGSGWYTWLVQDQRFLKDRTDVVSWQSEILDHDLVITGDIVAHLFASTTGSDSDWIVKLIDVYPETEPQDPSMAGYQLMVADEIFRGRFRNGFDKPAAITPDSVNEYVIDLHGNNHAFKKGHRVMVQVQSSWFPLYDRNPQKFVANIFTAQPSDYRIATQRVYESGRYPSHVTLPVIK